MRRHFLAFASSDLQRTLLRIEGQARDMGCYHEIHINNEFNLTAVFRNKFESKLKKGSRGFGHWCWKPQIILQLLHEVGDGDIIQYVDAGCHLNTSGLPRLLEYFEIARTAKNGILAFQAKPPDANLIDEGRNFESLPDYQWAKGDLIDYFGFRQNREVLESPTIGATVLFIMKCPEAIKIIEEWLAIIESDFSLIDDGPSASPNIQGFREHRHDQAIFSLLCKKHTVTLLSAYEYWYPSENKSQPDWQALKNYPVHARRDKDFEGSKKNNSLLKRFFPAWRKEN